MRRPPPPYEMGDMHHNYPDYDHQYPYQNDLDLDRRPSRPAPPIWLPPPPPLSSEENSRASSALGREHDDDGDSEEDYDSEDAQHPNFIDPSDPNQQIRWGRSNFTHDEIHALDVPLQTIHNNKSSSSSVFPTKRGGGGGGVTLCQKAIGLILIILPALCFTTAAHFINDIMTDFKLFSASFSVFQGVFWPCFIFLVIDLITGNKCWQNEDEEEVGVSSSPSSRFVGLCCTKLALWLVLHSVLSSISVISQLLSIQRLNISVSLALSFSSTIFVILLASIHREKRFSVELVTFSILGYFGFIVVGIPAMREARGLNAEELTAGVIASLIAASTAVPATFILSKLRQEKVLDSLTATSFAFHGSVFSLIIKIWMDHQSSPSSISFIGFDPISIRWAAGLIILVILGSVFTLMEGRFLQNSNNNNYGFGNCNILRMRLLIFVFSCGWEIIRQGIWTTFPDVYDILGSVLVFSAFLLSVGFEAWSLRMSQEVKASSQPFQFLAWLFSTGNTSNNTATTMRKG